MNSTIGAAPGGFSYGMRAFRHRDFRLFFLGALVSNSGSALQSLAIPYVILEITESSLWVGMVGFALMIPGFLVGPLGGSLADQQDRRAILLATQAAMATAAFALWWVWTAGWHDPWLILGITAISGLFSGLMIPSWQSFVASLIPRSDLSSAITLNSAQFNGSRAIGPAMAGGLIAIAGPGWAFFLNGVSFITVLAALFVIRPTVDERPEGARPSTREGFGEAVRYMRQRTGIVLSVGCAMLVAFFGNPTTQFTVVFNKFLYHGSPAVLGWLTAAVGLGAVVVAPVISTWDTRVARSTVVRWSLPIYAASIIAFGLAPIWQLALVSLLVSGAGFLAVIATTNTSIQMIVADEMRGRVMSVRIMGFTLAFPFGSLAQGALADAWGPRQTVTVFGSMLLAFAVYLALKPSLLRTLDAETDAVDVVPR